ncbi:MutS-like protein, partial [Cichlidogyrus casuarinus]
EVLKVITGPNMGGKSTFIRGVGILVVMAQMGSFVPCAEMLLTPIDAVMARVGASDCLIRGVSTFLAEMLETAAVLRSASPKSLVIVDELGRGTSTYDGLGLAWSIAHHLATDQALGCFSLFATHFHELTSLADELPNKISNYCVKARINSEDLQDGFMGRGRILMEYRVEPGVCQKSYGMDVAHLVGLPDIVIKNANEKALSEQEVENIWLALSQPQSASNNVSLSVQVSWPNFSS